MRALVEEVVRAVAVAQIVEAPRLPGRGARADRFSRDQRAGAAEPPYVSDAHRPIIRSCETYALLAFGDNVVVSRQRSTHARHSGANAMLLTTAASRRLCGLRSGADDRSRTHGLRALGIRPSPARARETRRTSLRRRLWEDVACRRRESASNEMSSRHGRWIS
jgi:hypothetical protein